MARPNDDLDKQLAIYEKAADPNNPEHMQAWSHVVACALCDEKVVTSPACHGITLVGNAYNEISVALVHAGPGSHERRDPWPASNSRRL